MPPPAEEVVKVYWSMAKLAVTDISESMMIVAGLLLPERSPVQFTKFQLTAAVAWIETEVPSSYEWVPSIGIVEPPLVDEIVNMDWTPVTVIVIVSETVT